MVDKRDNNRRVVGVGCMADRPFRSFYSYIRSPVILLKLHGLFPFENVRSQKYHDDGGGHSLSFKWFGRNGLWGLSLYATISIVLYRLSFSENANRMGLYGYIIQDCLYFISYSINGHKFATALACMEQVNEKFVYKSRDIDFNFATSLQFWILFEIWSFIYCCLKETMSVMSETKSQSSIEFGVTVLVGALSSMIEVYVVILYLMMSSLINLHYEVLNRELYSQLNCIFEKTNILEEFEWLRILHADLSDASDYLFEWFSLTSICIFSLMMIKMLLNVFLITIVYNRFGVIKDCSTFLFIFAYLFILTTSSQKLADSNKKICDIVRNTPTLALSTELQFQLRLAVLQTTTLPINTKALGLFDTTRRLIPSMLSVVAVYITVIIELERPLGKFANMFKRRSNYTSL